MGLFGSSKKNVTTTTTQATQNTSNISADAGSILAGDGTIISVDNSEDYRYTDSRDMSSYTALTENNSTAYNDSSTNNDARSWSTVNYEISGDVVKSALDLVDNADERRSLDARYAMEGAYNNSLEFFDLSAKAVRDGYSDYASTLADSTVRTINAVEEANRTDGQAILETVNNWGKYAAMLVGAVILVSFLRRA